MANIMDYLVWRGEFPMDVTPWCPVDALLLASLSYLNFHGTDDSRGWTLEEAARIDLLKESQDGSFAQRKALFEAMAGSRRFGDMRMHHFIAITDEDIAMQFSAECFDLPDGTVCVAFRGTDNTLIGWHEDFNMAYLSPVPSQEAATYYLEQAAGMDGRRIRIVGHSKGGNLAVYAAAGVPESIQERIEGVYTFDGPGLSPETAAGEGYGRIRHKIRSYVPQTSIIGMLMEYHRDYTVVHAAATGIMQHDPFTWQVYGNRFEEMEEIDKNAKLICETLHEWLENSDTEQRAAFVETLFRLADSTKATTMSDLLGEKLKNLMSMLGSTREVEPETRRIFGRLMAQFITLGVGNVIERYKGRKGEEGENGRMETQETENTGGGAL